MIRIDVIGVEPAVARFAALAVGSEAATDAAEVVGAEAVLARAEGYVPVDTGTLRDSLHIENEDDAELVITDVSYAPYVEYGTSDTAAQPFLRPAADAASPEFEQATVAALEALIRGVL